jgi:uncharacterized membrane protein YvlD (DUF360 family)
VDDPDGGLRQGMPVTATVALAGERPRPFWERLSIPNPLLWLGFLSEPVVAGTLVLVAPIAAAFEMARFPLDYLGPIALAPVAVLLADTLHKLLIRKRERGQRPSRLAAAAHFS